MATRESARFRTYRAQTVLPVYILTDDACAQWPRKPFFAGALASLTGGVHSPRMDCVIPGPLTMLSLSRPRSVIVEVPSSTYRAGPESKGRKGEKE